MSFPTRADALTVTELVGYIADVFREEPVLSDCAVRGEISGYHYHERSGHRYFTLKDRAAELSCVLFAREGRSLTFEPTDGLAVVARGRLGVFERQGKMQLYCDALRHDGLGALWEAFERLREQLAAEGLFDPARKRPLPRYPRRVALITSPVGAAVQDMRRILRQRWPAARVLLVPAAVQGPEAIGDLVRALTLVNGRDDVDVVLIGRGGGSIEDLWAFNEEAVARAVAASRIPVISAVGHETDTTICDFVADVRAATPTHAAQLAVPDRAAVAQELRELDGRLSGAVRRLVEGARLRLEAVARAAVLQRPEAIFEQRAQRLDDLDGRLRLAAERRVELAAGRLAGLAQTLAALDPTAVLGRGYAILMRDADGHIVMAPSDLPPGTPAVARVAQGDVNLVAR